MKQSVQNGFTLIELMIVVAIIGILASIAIPSYTDYIARSQASEATALLSSIKSPIAEMFTTKGIVPNIGNQDNEIPVLQNNGTFVSSVQETANNSGRYEATFRNSGVSKDIQSRTIQLIYSSSENTFTWNCTDLTPEVQPKSCT